MKIYKQVLMIQSAQISVKMNFFSFQAHQLEVVLSKKRDPSTQVTFLSSINGVSII